MKPSYRFIILLLVLSIPFTGLAQLRHYHGRNFKYRGRNYFKVNELLSVYGSLGISNYYGDLCDNFYSMQPRPNIGAGIIYRLSGYVSSKSEINYFRLYSKDVWPDRNLSFRSGNVEIYTSIMYDYFAYTKNMRQRKFLSPYVFAGLGIVFYNPRAELNGQWYSLRSLKTEGVSYGIATPIIPFGVGFKIKYTRNWDFITELGYRITFSDHLDDVSSYKFKKQADFTDPVAASLSNRTKQGDSFLGYRGNPNKNDGYFILSVKARYTFTMKHQLRNKYTQPHRKVY